MLILIIVILNSISTYTRLMILYYLTISVAANLQKILDSDEHMNYTFALVIFLII